MQKVYPNVFGFLDRRGVGRCASKPKTERVGVELALGTKIEARRQKLPGVLSVRAELPGAACLVSIYDSSRIEHFRSPTPSASGRLSARILWSAWTYPRQRPCTMLLVKSVNPQPGIFHKEPEKNQTMANSVWGTHSSLRPGPSFLPPLYIFR